MMDDNQQQVGSKPVPKQQTGSTNFRKTPPTSMSTSQTMKMTHTQQSAQKAKATTGIQHLPYRSWCRICAQSNIALTWTTVDGEAILLSKYVVETLSLLTNQWDLHADPCQQKRRDHHVLDGFAVVMPCVKNLGNTNNHPRQHRKQPVIQTDFTYATAHLATNKWCEFLGQLQGSGSKSHKNKQFNCVEKHEQY